MAPLNAFAGGGGGLLQPSVGLAVVGWGDDVTEVPPVQFISLALL